MATAATVISGALHSSPHRALKRCRSDIDDGRTPKRPRTSLLQFLIKDESSSNTNANKPHPALVLDLDNTLLHSVTANKLLQRRPMWKTIVAAQDPDPEKMLYPVQVSTGRGGVHKEYFWTKLRPGVLQFLKEADKIYQLHVCNIGTRAYAKKMCRLLDASGKLFGGRIMSREDFLNPKFKDLHCFKSLTTEALQ